MVQWTEKFGHVVMFCTLNCLKLTAEKKKKRKQFVLGPFDLYWLVKTISFFFGGWEKGFSCSSDKPQLHSFSI